METDNLIEGADIVRFFKAQRIKWLGHIQRLDQPRPTGKLLYWKPIGTRPVGKPRQRWQEDVMEDLKKIWKSKTGKRQLRIDELGETWLRRRNPTKCQIIMMMNRNLRPGKTEIIVQNFHCLFKYVKTTLLRILYSGINVRFSLKTALCSQLTHETVMTTISTHEPSA